MGIDIGKWFQDRNNANNKKVIDSKSKPSLPNAASGTVDWNKHLDNNRSEFEKNGGVNDDARLAAAIARNVKNRSQQTPLANGVSMFAPDQAEGANERRAFRDGTDLPPQQAAPQYSQQNYTPEKYNYRGKSADQMANEEFGPQFAMLEKMRGNASKNYNDAGNKIGAMYSHLAGAIRGDAPAVKQEYTNTGQGIGNAYNEAINSTKQDFTESRGNVATLAQRLGVSEAVPSAVQESTNQEGNLVGLLNANKANQVTLNSQLGQNESDYNRSEANISDAAGVNAKSDFAQRLQVALQNMDQQKLSLSGQRTSARNKYDLDIQGLLQKGQSENNNFANDRAKLDSSNRFKTADADLEQNKFEETKRSNLANESNRSTSGGAATKETADRAYTTLRQNAQMEYGDNQEGADQAQKIVEDAFNKSGGGGTLNGFLDYVQNNYSDVQSEELGPKLRDRGDQQTLLRLAALFYNQVNRK